MEITIDITSEALHINGEALSWPLSAAKLQEMLGEARILNNQFNYVYTWDKAGIYAYATTEESIESLILYMQHVDYLFTPTDLFAGNFSVNGKAYQCLDWKRKNKLDREIAIETENYSIYVELDDTEEITVIELTMPMVMDGPNAFADFDC